MTSNLLNCTICPKKPTFSDVSHLLTHVGSKGHLAHLHSLQVRSHQEIDAGRKLNVYNQWFQAHGVAALLSDRMQQKEQKQADKKAANHRRMAANSKKAKSKTLKTIKKQENLSLDSACPTKEQVVDADEDTAEFEHTHVPAGGAISQYPLITSSPPAIETETKGEDEEYVDLDIEVPARGSPGSPKLKGTQWPGMALFDAAPEDLRRKRNQRKDSSVLEKLERNAALVQPTETVHSAIGTVLKHRHMDDLEDDSPVEGEEVVPEPTPKRRKTGIPRNRRHPSSASNTHSALPRRRPTVTPVKASASLNNNKSRSALHSSPMEKGSVDLKVTFRKLDRKKKKKNTFTIFEDSPPPLGVDGSYEAMPSAYVDTGIVRPQLVFRPMPFFRDQAETYDPFKAIRDRPPTTVPGFADLGRGKENNPDSYNGINHGSLNRSTANPLFFHTDGRYGTNDTYTHRNPLSSPVTAQINSFSVNDTFMPTRNPLILAMEQLHKREAGEEDFAFDDATIQHHQPLFAP